MPDQGAVLRADTVDQVSSHHSVLIGLLALAAAFLFAAAAAIQQNAARSAEPSDADAGRSPTGLAKWLPIARVMRQLLRSRQWLSGWLVNLAGFVAQAAALQFGSIAFVQPLLVAQLLFTVPLASWQMRQWPEPRDWLAGALISGGVALFLIERGGVAGTGNADRFKIVLAALAAVLLAGLLLFVALRRPSLRAVVVAVAAGLFFALSAVFIKLTATELFGPGVAATATDWPGYALAGSTVIGLLLEHDAFRAGALPVSIAAITISNPVASYAIGVLAFDVSLPTGADDLAGIAGSAAMLVAGTLLLARSPIVRRDHP